MGHKFGNRATIMNQTVIGEASFGPQRGANELLEAIGTYILCKTPRHRLDLIRQFPCPTEEEWKKNSGRRGECLPSLESLSMAFRPAYVRRHNTEEGWLEAVFRLARQRLVQSLTSS